MADSNIDPTQVGLSDDEASVEDRLRKKRAASPEQQNRTVLQKLSDRDYPALHKEADDAVDKYVFDPLAESGHPDLAAAAGTAAGTAADYMIPNSDMEAAASFLPLGKIGKLAGVEEKAVSKLPGLVRSEESTGSKLNTLANRGAPKPTSGLYQQMIRDPNVMQKAAEDLPAAEQGYAAGQKQIRAGAQDIRDTKAGLQSGTMGADAAPFQGDYVTELAKDDAGRISNMRNAETDSRAAYNKPDAPTDTSKAIVYTDPRAQRISLKNERVNLNMNDPKDRIRMKQIDDQLDQLANGSIQSRP